MPQKLALAHIYGLNLTVLCAEVLNVLLMTPLHAQFHMGQNSSISHIAWLA